MGVWKPVSGVFSCHLCLTLGRFLLPFESAGQKAIKRISLYCKGNPPLALVHTDAVWFLCISSVISRSSCGAILLWLWHDWSQLRFVWPYKYSSLRKCTEIALYFEHPCHFHAVSIQVYGALKHTATYQTCTALFWYGPSCLKRISVNPA